MTSNDQAQLSFRDLEFQRSARSCSVKPDTTAIYAHGEVANLRQSGSIDVVMFIFREEMYKPDNSELDGRADVIFAKRLERAHGQGSADVPKEIDLIRISDGPRIVPRRSIVA